MTGPETVDILSAVGYARFLGSHPKQVCVIDIYALDAYLLLELRVLIDVTWLDGFHRMGIDIHLHQSQLVTADPDVTATVASHTVDVAVNTDACQSQ